LALALEEYYYNWLLNFKLKRLVLYCNTVLSYTDIKENELIFFFLKGIVKYFSHNTNQFWGKKIHAKIGNRFFKILE